jgi:hypothetical protein
MKITPTSEGLVRTMTWLDNTGLQCVDGCNLQDPKWDLE